jgi:hypothetical protein
VKENEMPNVVKTKFMTLRTEEVAGVGKNENGALFVVFRSGATHSIKYDKPDECARDYDLISDAVDADYGPTISGPKLVGPEG